MSWSDFSATMPCQVGCWGYRAYTGLAPEVVAALVLLAPQIKSISGLTNKREVACLFHHPKRPCSASCACVSLVCLADRPLVKPDVASEYAFPKEDVQRLGERLDSNTP